MKTFSALCAMETFEINGVRADSHDFGTQGDESPETAEPYCCGDMRFTAKPATSAILKKYNITVDEYNEIATKLESSLSWGSCGWCS